VTVTPTITPTPVPFPYIITIGVYNEAGELVKTVMSSPANQTISEILLQQNNANLNGMMVSGSPLQIILSNVETPDTIGLGSSSFIWNSDTNAAQSVGSGVYYIKFEEKDRYGHTNVIVRQMILMNTEQYVAVDIYNSAGELVREMKEYKDVSSMVVKLKVASYIVIEKGDNSIDIGYGTGLTDYVLWDGKSSRNTVVQNGTYEIQINVLTNTGKATVASKTVLIQNEGEKFLSDVKIVPNPFNIFKSASKKLTFDWMSGSEGDMNIYIYNMAGELVKQLNAKLLTKTISWDAKTSDRSKISNGYYIAVFESRSDDGHTDRKMLKFAVVGKK
jgi:flagellar hook assembly protein FlgD